MYEGATLESVKTHLTNSTWGGLWEPKHTEVIEETEEGVAGAGTLEVYNRNMVKLGNN